MCDRSRNGRFIPRTFTSIILSGRDAMQVLNLETWSATETTRLPVGCSMICVIASGTWLNETATPLLWEFVRVSGCPGVRVPGGLAVRFPGRLAR